MRKLIIFVYFVFLFKIAFGPSLPTLSTLTGNKTKSSIDAIAAENKPAENPNAQASASEAQSADATETMPEVNVEVTGSVQNTQQVNIPTNNNPSANVAVLNKGPDNLKQDDFGLLAPDIEPSAGTAENTAPQQTEPSRVQLAQASDVPPLENSTDNTLPADFDLPAKEKTAAPPAGSNVPAANTQVPNDSDVPPAIPAADAAVSDVPEIEVPETDTESTNIPGSPAAPAVTAPAAVPAANSANTAADQNKAAADTTPEDPFRKQFPDTPALNFNEKPSDKKSKTEVKAEPSAADREKEIDNLLNDVFTPKVAEKQEKPKDTEEVKKNPESENIINVDEKPMASIDDLANDQEDLSEIQDVKGSKKKKSSGEDDKEVQTSTIFNSSTYSESQLSNLLVQAAMRGDKRTVAELLHSGRSPDAQNSFGESPLMASIYSNNNEIVEMLLSEKANPNIADNKGNTALLVAAAKGNQMAAQELIKAGANIDAANNVSDTPLLVAALNSDLNMVQTLARQGADVNKANAEGLTALHIAAYNGNSELTAYLISAGANANAPTKGGYKPYDLALQKNPQVAAYLASYTAGIQKQNSGMPGNMGMSAGTTAVTPVAVEQVQSTPIDNSPQIMYTVPPMQNQNPAPATSSIATNRAKPVEERRPLIQTTPDYAMANRNSGMAEPAKPSVTAPVNNLQISTIGTEPATTSGQMPVMPVENQQAKPASIIYGESKKWTKLTGNQQNTQSADLKPQETMPAQQQSSAITLKTNETVKAQYDNNGNIIGYNPVPSSSAPDESAAAPEYNAKLNTAGSASTEQNTTGNEVNVSDKPVQKPASLIYKGMTSNINPPANHATSSQPQTAELPHPVTTKPEEETISYYPIEKAAPQPDNQIAAAKAEPVKTETASVKDVAEEKVQLPANLSIPKYAQLEPSKQAVWDMKLSEWVKNGRTISLQDSSQKNFWMKQQLVLQAVYQNQFDAKVTEEKLRLSRLDGINTSPVHPVISKADFDRDGLKDNRQALPLNVNLSSVNNRSAFN